MAVGDLYNLTIHLSSTSSSGIIVLGYKQTVGTNDQDTLKSACEFFAVNQMLLLRACLALDVHLNQLTMHQVTPGNDIPGIHPVINLAGLRVGDSLPFSSAAVATKITDAPNAKFNGRYYCPGISEDDQDDGTLNATILALLVLWNIGITDTLSTSLPQTAKFEAAVISRFEDGVPRVPPIGFNVESMIQRVHLKQQRRRVTEEVGFSG